MFNEFSEEELDESRRRVIWSTGILENHLATHEWIAGEHVLARRHQRLQPGLCIAAVAAAVCNDEKTPHIMEWLRRIYERPATRQTWAKGRTPMASRVAMLERSAPAAQ